MHYELGNICNMAHLKLTWPLHAHTNYCPSNKLDSSVSQATCSTTPTSRKTLTTQNCYIDAFGFNPAIFICYIRLVMYDFAHSLVT